jgi:hypothetical protein
MPPPSLPGAKSFRLASALNLFLPGAGLIYLGHRRTGGVLVTAFLFCFFALISLFLISYARYLELALSDDLLKGDKLERIGNVFPRGWLIGLTAAGLMIYAISSALMVRAKRNSPSRSTA